MMFDLQAATHAYCVLSLGLLLFFLACFLQGSTGWGLDGQVESRFPRVLGNTRSNATSWNDQGLLYVFNSSSQLDWIQATVGGATGSWTEKVLLSSCTLAFFPRLTCCVLCAFHKGNRTYVVLEPRTLPFMGSIFSGAVLAYLTLSTLLSIYLGLTATPEGEGSIMLMLDPRGLTVANGVVAFASTQGVGQIFAFCSQDVAGGCALFFLFAFLVCWTDQLPVLVLWLADKLKAQRMKNAGFRKLKKNDDDGYGGYDGSSGASSSSSSSVSRSQGDAAGYVMVKVFQSIFVPLMAFVPPSGVMIVHSNRGSVNVPWTIVVSCSLLLWSWDVGWMMRWCCLVSRFANRG